MTWAKGRKLQAGKYVIEQVLGQGGFGITYKALQVSLNRPVVIKTPNEYLQDDPEYHKYIDKFIREGQILARLSQDPHPHIVGVIELFEEDTTHCLVMEFVPGENLFQIVKRRGALPEAESIPYIRQIGEALMMVHQLGLVHRDAHPGNIMIRENGRAVLIDFGISKQIIPATQSSTDKSAHERFAPYEQRYKGSRDPRVDIYSLAAALYYTMTAQNPTNSLARKLDNAPLIPPQQIIPSISNQLNQAILRGMALEAKDRPQSMQEWLAMLSYSPQVPSCEVEISKAIPSPPCHEDYRKEVVHSTSESHGQTSVNTPIGTIFWGGLGSYLLFYGLTGYYLAATNTQFWATAIVVVGTLAIAWWLAVAIVGAIPIARAVVMAVPVARTVMGFLTRACSVLYRAWPVYAVVAVAVLVSSRWAILMAVVAGIVVAVAVAVLEAGTHGDELETSFNEFHAFLILTGTSGLGLVLGWIIYIFYS